VTDSIDEKYDNLQPPNIFTVDELQLLAKVPDIAQIERVEKDIKFAQKELTFELGQTALDVVGIVDPTPISDSISAVMSLSRGDYVGAALSTVGIIPYIGDAIGKPIKEVHNAKRIAQLEQKIEGLVKQLKELAPERIEKAAENMTEAVAKGRSILIEKVEKGHSLLRHGPDLTDNQLIKRLKEGIAPDGKIESGTRVPGGSTRFSSHADWLQIREKASEQITKRAPYNGGVDLTKPPVPGSREASKGVSRIIEFDRPIGDGFVGKKGTLHEITAKNGRKLDVYGDVEKVEDLTRIKVTYKWNGKEWEAKQFFPDATDYDPVTRQYTKEPDTNFIKTKLPSVVEQKASLDLGEKEPDTVAQQTPAIAENTRPTAKLVSYSVLDLDSASPLSRTYQANQITQAIVDNDPQLKSAITAGAVYERLIKASGANNTLFQDYQYTASQDPQTEKLTISALGRGPLIEYESKAALKILQPLTAQDSQRFETIRTQLNRGQTIAQTPPPNAAQQEFVQFAELSDQALRKVPPGQLLAMSKAVQQWQKERPYAPHDFQAQSAKTNYETKSQEVSQLSRAAQQAKQTYEQMEKNQRSLLNPFGVSPQKVAKAEQSWAAAKGGLDYQERELRHFKSTYRDSEQGQQERTQWQESPLSQVMRRVQERLGTPSVQENVQEAQRANQGFRLAQQASKGLNRPYQGEIEQARMAYMERGEVPSQELSSAMNQDIKRYEQMAQNQQADGGLAL
jgi:hypothetical protein